jgi:hypothetical protein
LELFSLWYSIGRSQQMFFRAFVTQWDWGFQMWNNVLVTFVCSLRNVGLQML